MTLKCVIKDGKQIERGHESSKKGSFKLTTIRPMQPADKEAVLAMMEVFYASPAVFSNGSATIYSSDFEACVSDNPYLEGYMFEENGQIQGYAMTAKSFSTEFGRPCIWVEDLYIKEAFRGTGIGSLVSGIYWKQVS